MKFDLPAPFGPINTVRDRGSKSVNARTVLNPLRVIRVKRLRCVLSRVHGTKGGSSAVGCRISRPPHSGHGDTSFPVFTLRGCPRSEQSSYGQIQVPQPLTESTAALATRPPPSRRYRNACPSPPPIGRWISPPNVTSPSRPWSRTGVVVVRALPPGRGRPGRDIPGGLNTAPVFRLAYARPAGTSPGSDALRSPVARRSTPPTSASRRTGAGSS